jgi:ATP-binding cassette subfamily B protein
MQKRYRQGFPASLMYGNLWSASTMLQGMMLAFPLLLGIYLWDNSAITLGGVFLIYTYTELIYGPLQQFRDNMGGMQNARAAMIRVNEMMGIPIKIEEGDKTLDAESVSLEIRDLSFGYDEGRDVLHHIDLSIAAGERLGLAGETGCGKSTLAGLIARLYTFDRGHILLNGIDIKELRAADLRKSVAYCTQNVQLIHGTLRDNITLFDRGFTDGDIHRAVEKLDLREWFEKFPGGLDTYLEMGEGNLSAGEAQLVTIIRMALLNPKIVVLDEITSRLDGRTEERVITAMKKLCRNKTVMAIAHRASAINWMDRVIYIDRG